MTSDDTQITALFDAMLRAWTDGDAVAYGACVTEDCDYVPFDGSRSLGRQAVIDSHDKLFRGVLTGSALVGQVESIRYLRPDVAIVHTTGSVRMPWRSSLPKKRLSRQTLVAVREPGGWLFAAFHNGRVKPVRIPEPDSMPAKMSRLLTRVARALGFGRRAASAEVAPVSSPA